MTNDQGIHDTVAALERAWNAHDADAWTAMFLPDATFTNVFGIEMSGRDAILRTHRHIMTTLFRDSHAEMHATSIRYVRADVASVTIRWRMSGAYDLRGNPWGDREGLMPLVMTAQPEGWRIAVFHNMDLPKPEQIAAIEQELAGQTR